MIGTAPWADPVSRRALAFRYPAGFLTLSPRTRPGGWNALAAVPSRKPPSGRPLWPKETPRPLDLLARELLGHETFSLCRSKVPEASASRNGPAHEVPNAADGSGVPPCSRPPCQICHNKKYGIDRCISQSNHSDMIGHT
jgi:hypothetical protein